MRAGRRGAFGVANSRGDLRPRGGGCGGGSGGAGSVWLNVHGIRGSRRELVSGWLRWATGCGGGGIFRFWDVGSGTGGRYRAGRAIPVTCRVVFGTVAATCRGGDAAVKDWLEVSTLGAGWVGAAVLRFAWEPAQRGQTVGFLQRGLTWPNLQQLLHCLEGDEGYALSIA